tara:strand:- start:22 stop:378 length:357 start_codon:yes stop_codon:yes gene_type:complete
MHKIILEDIKIFAYHGVYNDEIKNGQNFYLSIEYKQEFNSDLHKDSISSVLDYAVLIKDIKIKFNEKRYMLIEALGNDLFNYLIEKYKFFYLKLIIKKDNEKLNRTLKNIIIEIESEK